MAKPRFARTLATFGITAAVTAGLAFSGNDQVDLYNDLVALNAAENGVTSIVSVQATVDQTAFLAEHFDLTEHGRDGWYDVVAYPGDKERLTDFGFVWEQGAEDLFAIDLYQRMREEFLAENLRKSPVDMQPCERYEGYRTWADHDADIRKLAADNPEFTRLIELPNKTHEGRTVNMLQVTTNPDAAFDDGRPSSILMGLHHAREWPSAELTLMFACDIVERYASGDAEIVDMLGKVNLLIIPVVNPDGYVRSRETISDSVVNGPGGLALVSEFAYHRKNMRFHADGRAAQLLDQGVDPNRNYPYKWGGAGTSDAVSTPTYRGPGPGSEPEIQNILGLLRDNHVTTLISNHTYSELVLRPFGDTLRDTPDEEIIKGHADAMAAINKYSSIKGIQLYATTGTTEDWVYGVTGAPSFTFEIAPKNIEPAPDPAGLNSYAATPADCMGFHATYQLCVGDFYKQNVDAYILNVKEAANEAWHSHLEGTAPAGTKLTLTKDVEVPLSIIHEEDDFMAEHLEATMTVGADGTFTWHVNPSPMPQTILDIEDGYALPVHLETYTLTATRPDGSVQVIENVLVWRGETYTFTF